MKKSYLIAVFSILLLSGNSIYAQNVTDNNSVTGSWLGKISTGALNLRVVFNLSIIEKDSLVATLDSPDQGAKGIKLGPVTFTGDSLKISAGALRAKYEGRVTNDSTIEGTWTQAGVAMSLDLKKLKSELVMNRPQEPKPPFPYSAEDVTFRNSKFNIELAGTVTIPKGTGPFPAVILITGSGPQNRDEEIFGHKPFMVIADYLSRHGIAVLRYDDRGVGKSQGTYATATSADLATDAEAAYEFLKTYPKINSKDIGLLGHSEGGLIAPIVASTNPGIAFIVSLAGPGVSGEKVILKQAQDIGRLSGASEAQIEEGTEVNSKLYAVLKKESDNKIAEEKIMALYKEILEKKEYTKRGYR